MFEKEIAALHKSSGLSIKFLKEAVMATKDAMEKLRKEKDAEIMRMAEAHAKQISDMRARMDHLEKVADRRRKWVQALQVQIGRMRAEAARLAEERRKQHEAWERERSVGCALCHPLVLRARTRAAWSRVPTASSTG